MPVIVGTTTFILAVINLIMVLLRCSTKSVKETATPGKESDNSFVDMATLKKTLLIILILALYVYLMRYIGYLISTFLAVFALVKSAGNKGWLRLTIISMCVAVGFYMLFASLLGVLLPKFPGT